MYLFAATFRACSLRLLLYAGIALLLFPVVGRLLMLTGAPDPRPTLTFTILLLVSVVSIQLFIHIWQRRFRRRHVDRPLVSHSWPDARQRLLSGERRLDTALFFPWQAARIRREHFPAFLKSASGADEPDTLLLRLLRDLLYHADVDTAARARELFLRQFAANGDFDPEVLQVMLHIYSTSPESAASYHDKMQAALVKWPRWRNRASFDFMQAFPHAEFLAPLTRLFARLHDAPVADLDLLKQLLDHPDCRRRFRRIARRKLARLVQPSAAQTQLLSELNAQLGPASSERITSAALALRERFYRPRLLYGTAGVVALIAIIWVSVWLIDFSQPEEPSPRYLMTAAQPAYTVQVMATRDSLYAIKEAKRLGDCGYFTYIMSPRVNSTYFRVRTGQLAMRAEADTLAQLLLRKKLITEFYVAPYDSNGIIIPID